MCPAQTTIMSFPAGHQLTQMSSKYPHRQMEIILVTVELVIPLRTVHSQMTYNET